MGAPKRKLVLKKDQHHTSNPQYMTGNLKEYIIKFKEGRGWFLHKYHGGPRPKALQGYFTTHEKAERALITYIIKTNRTGLARYPGCPEPRQTNYTRTFLKDWLPR